jgi:hypothetical protein
MGGREFIIVQRQEGLSNQGDTTITGKIALAVAIVLGMASASFAGYVSNLAKRASPSISSTRPASGAGNQESTSD